MITCYFGLPGSGKTCLATSICQKFIRNIAREIALNNALGGNANESHYKKVFTNFHCDNCYKIKFEELGVYNFDNCLIVLDEITLDADNRDFKQFKKSSKYFFSMHRHYDCDIIYCTQDWQNVDKKIRDNTYNLFYIRPLFDHFPILKKIFPITVIRTIYRQLVINEMTNEIQNGYRFPTFIEKLFCRTTRLLWRPSWYEYFDTKEKTIELKTKDFEKWKREESNPPPYITSSS